MNQIAVSRRKGRLLGATIGGLLLGPLGAVIGLGLGTRTETELEERKSAQERAEELRGRREAYDAGRYRRREMLIAQGKDPDFTKKVIWAVIAGFIGLPLLLHSAFRLGEVLGQALW